MTTTQAPRPADPQRSAHLSDDGRYRYGLWRGWAAGPTALFVMLNPSMADADRDDNTLRRCMDFAHREGCGSLHVVNLYAFRSSDPLDLARARGRGVDITGGTIAASVIVHSADQVEASGGPTILAWGKRPAGLTALAHNHRIADVLALVPRSKRCLDVNCDGSPRHPLYLPADTPLVDWPVR